MATIPDLRPARPSEDERLLNSLARLASLELELGLAETRSLLRSLVIEVAVAVVAGIALVAALLLLVAAAFAPLFAAAWEHLVIAGGGTALLALGALAWTARRLRRRPWPHRTLDSLQETWRWLGAQLRSRLT